MTRLCSAEHTRRAQPTLTPVRRKCELTEVSIVIPVYNEQGTLAEVVRRVRSLACNPEVVIVDDGSTDASAAIVQSFQGTPRIRIASHIANRGKGAALRTGFELATGDIVVILDADLEYDPDDITRVIQPIAEGESDVVFGSRYLSRTGDQGLFRAANAALTWLSNCATSLSLTDMETCLKAFRRKVLCDIAIREDRFGVEPELTAKVARGGWRICEAPISYSRRTYQDGKKIGWRDGFRAAWCIVRYSWWD